MGKAPPLKILFYLSELDYFFVISVLKLISDAKQMFGQKTIFSSPDKDGLLLLTSLIYI